MTERCINYEVEADKRTWWLNNTGGDAKDNLTVRDYFAAKAIEGICTAMLTKTRYNYDLLAADAYAMADAMMKARILDKGCRESRLKAERMAQAGEAW